MKILFTLGKGGVGKTTISFIVAIKSFEKSFKTALISLDPAHNLSDLAGQTIGDRVIEIKKGLFVQEIDFETRKNAHLKNVTGLIQREFRYLKSLDVDRFLNILKFAPVSEEYVFTRVLYEILKNFQNFDRIILDMPPTAIALRMITLPFISRFWAEHLLGIRKRLIELKKSVANIKGKNFKKDRVFEELLSYQEELENLINLFRSDKALFIYVVEPEKLAIYEARRIYENLKNFGILPALIVANKLRDEKEKSKIIDEFKNIPITFVPFFKNPPLDFSALQRVSLKLEFPVI